MISSTNSGELLILSPSLLDHCWPTPVFLFLACVLSRAFLKPFKVSIFLTQSGNAFQGSATLTDQKLFLISPFPFCGTTFKNPVVCLVETSPSLGWQSWNQVSAETLSFLVSSGLCMPEASPLFSSSPQECPSPVLSVALHRSCPSGLRLP